MCLWVCGRCQTGAGVVLLLRSMAVNGAALVQSYSESLWIPLTVAFVVMEMVMVTVGEEGPKAGTNTAIT